jgi:GIY-YIG catalytic domain-containing protein/HB1/ASXL restriction endonuclease-like protein with HTH domain
VERALRALDKTPRCVPAAAWAADLEGLDEAGLYSWWIDESGASDLRSGLDQDLSAGRIYAGQTGATKWPSGRAAAMTLRERLGSNHLRGSIYGSTFRRTLAACLLEPMVLCLVAPGKLARESEHELSAWMRRHLQVAVHAFPNRDALGDLEDCVLAALDPPLNLEGMQPTALRKRISQLRARLARGEGSPPVPGRRPPAVPVAEKELEPAQRPTLHDEIARILREAERPMTTAELADAVNQRALYIKRDGTAVTAFQVHGRTRNYRQLFERDGQTVKLRSS